MQCDMCGEVRVVEPAFPHLSGIHPASSLRCSEPRIFPVLRSPQHSLSTIVSVVQLVCTSCLNYSIYACTSCFASMQCQYSDEVETV